MQREPFKSFSDFYPYYLNEHRRTGTRVTHFIGTSAFLVLVIFAIVFAWWWGILLGIVAAYGMAWIGHFFIEKNKPATFQHPWWSLKGDFKLYFSILFGKETLKGD